jgi:RNA polymerase sigma-70 factor (ECF subfamily)
MEYPTARTQTDAELMTRVAGGDVRAFEAIYDRYHHQAYSLATRIAGRSGAAEEATQDAFLSLWKAAGGFDPERASLGTWLMTLVRNRSIDALRRVTQAMRHCDHGEGAAERIEAPERTDEQVLAADAAHQARRLVAGLPAEQREVIELAYFAGFTQQEIAARTGVPIGTIKGRARLGLGKLRQAV